MGGMDMGLSYCVASYMRPVCHQKRRTTHVKSPTVQRCHTNWFVWDRHGTSYAPDTSCKQAYAACKEAYSVEVLHDLICVTRPLVSRGLQCVALCCSVCCSVLQCVAVCVAVCVEVCCSEYCSICWFMWDIFMVPRVLQCVAVCCSVLQCVLQRMLMYARRLLGITWLLHYLWPDSFMCVQWLLHV